MKTLNLEAMDKKTLQNHIKKNSAIKDPNNNIFILLNSITLIDLESPDRKQKSAILYCNSKGENLVVTRDNFSFSAITEDIPKFKKTDYVGSNRRISSKLLEMPYIFLGYAEIFKSRGKETVLLYTSCLGDDIYCTNEDNFNGLTISVINDKKIKENIVDHYSDLKRDPKLTLWDGNRNLIPPENTLVSYSTNSIGLINGIVTGYNIKWRENKSIIEIKLTSLDRKTSNSRHFEDIELPLSDREKELLKKNNNL